LILRKQNGLFIDIRPRKYIFVFNSKGQNVIRVNTTFSVCGIDLYNLSWHGVKVLLKMRENIDTLKLGLYIGMMH
jgi:hypothetical protein